MLVERMRPYTSTIFAEMSALAAAHRRDQPRPGLPGHRRAAVAARRRRRQRHRRRQPVPAGPRRPGAAHRRRRAPAAVLRPRRRPRRRPGHDRAPPRRSPPRCSGCASRATRSSPSSRSTTPTPPRSRSPGAALRPVPLRPPTFGFDPDELRAAFSPRTRLVLVNTPHNPTGAVFTARAAHARSARWPPSTTRWSSPTRCTSTWSSTGASTSRWRRCPGMAERTLTISSAGKTFSVTGWKVGWVHGPRELVAAVRAAKQFLTYVVGRAVPARDRHRAGPARRLLRRPGRATCQRKRDLLADRAARRRVHGVPDARARTSSSPTPRRSASPTAPSSAGGCPS